MLKNSYNFVKAATSSRTSLPQSTLSGEQAQKIYLEEIKNATPANPPTPKLSTIRKHRQLQDFSKKDLFMCVQNDDVAKLRNILDSCPSSIDVVDEFGWSLLMIACQANSVDSVRELLKRGVDTSVRDKGGNSATNLVLKNKNLDIADLLISHNHKSQIPNSIDESGPRITKTKKVKAKIKENFKCESCNKDFPVKEEHIASTIHNINASKGKKIPPNYKIPQSNRGYKIMLRIGWDRDLGLGKDGSGKKYPIKVVQKIDKKGLGLEKKKDKQSNKIIELSKNSKSDFGESRRNERRMEMSFRREFY